MAAETETKTSAQFEADGEMYDYPDPLELDMDEWVIIYDETGLILEDFAPFQQKSYERERIKKLRNPALIKALAICGYMRAHRDADLEEVRELIGSLNMLGVLEQLAVGGDADDPTQESPSETDGSLPRSEDDSNANTSLGSPKPSGEPEESPEPIGTGE